MRKHRVEMLIAVVTVLMMVLSACGAPAAPAPAPAAPAAPAATAVPAAPAATAVPAAPAATEAPKPTEAAAAAPAASVNIPRNQTVIFDIDGGRVTAPDLWNPFVPGYRLDQGYHQAVLEPLFILNYQTGKFDPWLADSMTANATMDQWTMKLHKGAEWSDGVPFTADDVIFTEQMLMDHAADLGGSGLKEWVAKIEKVDDLTVKFTLTKPNPRFQLDFYSVKISGGGTNVIVPKHIWDGQDPLTFKFYDPAKGWPVGTGAYKLASISPTEFSYLRNDNWWAAKIGYKPLPAPKKLIWTWAGPEETRTALMADGQLDSLMDITLGALQALQQRNPNVVTWFKDMPKAWVPDPCSRVLSINDTLAPWDDPQMRWALNYIIDRDAIIKIAYEGSTIKSQHFFPQYPPLDRYVKLAVDAGQYKTYDLWTTDVKKAQQIIESKGYTKGSDGYYAKGGKQLTLLITTHEAFIELQRWAQLVVEEWQAAGINATNRNEAGGTWDTNRNMGNFETQAGWQMCDSVNEPWASMDHLNAKWIVPIGTRSTGKNEFRWNNQEYSTLVDEMGTLPLGDPKIDDLFVKANEIFLKELPVIPIAQARKIIPFDTTYWTNWPTFDNQYLHPPTWWMSTHEIIDNLKPTGK